MRDKHIPILDVLRCIAAMSVCFYHLVCTITGFIDSKIVLEIFSYGKYGVQMFFVISGLVIPWSLYHANYNLSSYPKFLLKRFIRLEPPYVVVIFIAITHAYLRALSPHYNGVDITPTLKQILLHFGYLIPFFEDQKWVNQVFWTLAVEFQYYVFIALLFYLINHKNKFWRWVSYAILIALSFIGTNKFFPYWTPVFMIGMLVFLYKVERIRLFEFVFMIVLSGILILININLITFIVSMTTLALILLAFNFSNGFFRWMGNISYSLYLIHTIIGAAFVNYLSHIVSHPLEKFFAVMGGVGISVLCSYVLYLVVERPSKRLSSKIKL